MMLVSKNQSYLVDSLSVNLEIIRHLKDNSFEINIVELLMKNNTILRFLLNDINLLSVTHNNGSNIKRLIVQDYPLARRGLFYLVGNCSKQVLLDAKSCSDLATPLRAGAGRRAGTKHNTQNSRRPPPFPVISAHDLSH